MPNPNKGDMDDFRKLLDRLAAVRPSRECMPELIVGQWVRGDPEARRTIEEKLDRMPKRKKSN
jgi:hypothetical protein